MSSRIEHNTDENPDSGNQGPSEDVARRISAIIRLAYAKCKNSSLIAAKLDKLNISGREKEIERKNDLVGETDLSGISEDLLEEELMNNLYSDPDAFELLENVESLLRETSAKNRDKQRVGLHQLKFGNTVSENTDSNK